ncbi:HypC/HybG/HupF family hydrogenase formation chaperone [Legionella pneumophila]|uniref:Hydrogenase expression/formation protein HypC n=1 Tax=Legionella pneumophila subsp. pascullei TaxID=91890 RepID=A0AAX2IZC9_LEGPN|nr:HypC/HybG/HupF family hydrogenase formation chaperone [Legionella pneumophila]AMP88962.1 hydrogenase assembly protein HypC [Legionella pneumophila subsp. pascullei]AMP93370.1 hydrogenase assembly protein HypC [Legionella pneumophila subsp. pascullei]AMP96336.1 hydrogenase assembly protein HypC [Legionella pneumophila subsp. pascullei]SQG91303.1 hydrogenase expression/formation protein HypC [Legionella pneumophila subsp. pascullei]VEH07849.1 hydrogenase expression/formation protein HypC [Leg
MCLALPAQIDQILEDNKAVVNLGGITKEISTVLLDQVSKGEYVIIHAGFALTKLDESEANKTLSLFDQMLKDGLK